MSDAAAHALARDMRTTPEFILNQPPYHFAAYVRGLTSTAISLGIPNVDMNRMPRMTEMEQNIVQQRIREQYATAPASARSVLGKTTPCSAQPAVEQSPKTEESDAPEKW